MALKVVRGGPLVSDSAVRMFQREVDTLARLEHPNIAAIYESGRTEDGHHFFAMELVRGQTLAEFLDRTRGELSAEQITRRLDLFRAIADAVHYAHQRGVIHRDLKPSNIIVTELPEEDESDSGLGLPKVKILDFGLARITEGDLAAATMHTEVGMIKGTLPYMSPEQARGDPREIDLRTDVYALGVILFEMLTGERPHDLDAVTVISAVRVICETLPKLLKSAWRGEQKLDADLDTIAGKALEKEADRRYASAATLSEDVARFEAQQPILARPPSAAYQIQKLIARNRLAATFVATLLLLVIGFGLWMSVLWRRSETARARAEANQLLALGRLEIRKGPSSALVVSEGPGTRISFSPDDRYLAMDIFDPAATRTRITLFDSGKGMTAIVDEAQTPATLLGFDETSSLLVSKRLGKNEVLVSSVPGGERLRSLGLPTIGSVAFYPAGGSRILAFTPAAQPGSWDLDTIDPETGTSRRSGDRFGGRLEESYSEFLGLDVKGRRLATITEDHRIQVTDLGDLENPEVIGRDAWYFTAFHPTEPVICTVNERGLIVLWFDDGSGSRSLTSISTEGASMYPRISPDGSTLVMGYGDGLLRLWDLQAPDSADPLVLRRRGQQNLHALAFTSNGRWLATGDNGSAALWPLARRYPVVLGGSTAPVSDLAFHPEGEWLLASNLEGWILLWPLGPGEGQVRAIGISDGDVSVDASGEQLVAVTEGGATLYSPEGRAQNGLAAFDDNVWSSAISPDGRFIAASGGQFVPDEAYVAVLDLDSGELTRLTAGDGEWVVDITFTKRNLLVASGLGGVRIWNLESGSFTTVTDEPSSHIAVSEDGESLARIGGGRRVQPGRQAPHPRPGLRDGPRDRLARR